MSIFDRLFSRTPRDAAAPADGAALARRLGVPSPDAPRELVLYGHDFCPYCRRVYRALAAMDIDVPRRDTWDAGDARRELMALNGTTQVPCLLIDGEPLLESNDIVDWLRAYAVSGASSSAAASPSSSDSHSA